MGSSKPGADQLDLYLQEIHIKERKRRKRFLITLCSIVTLTAIIGVFLYNNLNQPEQISYREYKIENLTKDRVGHLLLESEDPLIVKVDKFDLADTIYKQSEYYALLDEVDRLEVLSNAGPSRSFEAVPQAVVEKPEIEEEKEEKGILSVQGELKVGAPLDFRVENFKEDWKYRIRYGNGKSNSIRRERTYVYPRPGRFTAILEAFSPGGNKFETQYYMEIKAKEEKSDTLSSPNAFGRLTIPGGSDEALSGEENGLNRSETEVFIAKEQDTSGKGYAKVIRPSAEKMPSFPGGIEKLKVYLRENIKYPPEAVEDKVEGKVTVRFVVREDGKIDRVAIANGLSNACNAEAIRVVQNMPNWVPAEEKGEKVPVFSRLTLTFRLLDNL